MLLQLLIANKPGGNRFSCGSHGVRTTFEHGPHSREYNPAHPDGWLVVGEMYFFRSANDNTVLTREQIAMTTVKVLQLRLRREEDQLTLDRTDQMILPEVPRPKACTVDNDILR